MSSNKQRREELKAEREQKRQHLAAEKQKLAEEKKRQELHHLEMEGVNCDPSQLAPDGSYSRPDYVARGYYVDIPFTCKDCGKEDIWSPQQQKWWYEVAKGGVWTTARRCRDCRRVARNKKAEAKQLSEENTARNLLLKQKSTPHRYPPPEPPNESNETPSMP